MDYWRGQENLERSITCTGKKGKSPEALHWICEHKSYHKQLIRTMMGAAGSKSAPGREENYTITLSTKEISTLSNLLVHVKKWGTVSFWIFGAIMYVSAWSQDLVDQKYLAHSSPQQKGELFMFLLALTAAMRAGEGPSCRKSHVLCHLLFFLTDVMVTCKTAQTEFCPETCYFQCNSW